MITKKCRQCGKEFTLSDGEIDFFKSKGLELPSRCAECRKKNKAARNTPAPDVKNRPIAAVAAVLLILVALGFGYYISQINGAKLSNNEAADISEEIYTTAYELPETTAAITEAQTAEKVTEATTAAITEAQTAAEVTKATTAAEISQTESPAPQYRFRNSELLEEHYQKHGIEMGFASAEEYEKAAAAVITAPGVLHKYEKEDNDDVYYLESTNEFVIVSTDGFIRTYFKPNSGKDYFDRQ